MARALVEMLGVWLDVSFLEKQQHFSGPKEAILEGQNGVVQKNHPPLKMLWNSGVILLICSQNSQMDRVLSEVKK